MIELKPTLADDAHLDQYAALFAACFPGAGHLDRGYLRWLYRDNPAGPVLGFDAWSDTRLAAHYVCVPAMIRLEGRARPALLSLNTATHPDFQGQGLFTRLAAATYARGAEQGFELVYGVANANSTPGFLRKLGFGLVTPLDSWVGIGRLRGVDWQAAAGAGFARDWTAQALQWRAGNPARPVRTRAIADGSTGYFADSGRAGIAAWAQLPGQAPADIASGRPPLPRVFLGKIPGHASPRGAFITLPGRLRPSPLNLIVLGLREPLRVDPREVFFSFLDFDAF